MSGLKFLIFNERILPNFNGDEEPLSSKDVNILNKSGLYLRIFLLFISVTNLQIVVELKLQ